MTSNLTDPQAIIRAVARLLPRLLALLACITLGGPALVTPVDAHKIVPARHDVSVQARSSRPASLLPDRRLAPAIINAVRAAQIQANADPALLLAIAAQESDFNPLARNRQSSATGLLQFTQTTWLEMVRDFGARHGLAAYAAMIRTDHAGRIVIRRPHDRAAILRLRERPQLSAIMAAERLRSKGEALSAQLGRELSSADLYVLYLLGPTGAYHFLATLAQSPAASSVDVIGASARPNAGLFVRARRPLSLSQAYSKIGDIIAQQQARYASEIAAVTTVAVAEAP